MMYVQVKKLPKDCVCFNEYPFPFKLTGHKLYVYEPDVNCFGEAVWFRRTHDVKSPVAVKLSELKSKL